MTRSVTAREPSARKLRNAIIDLFGLAESCGSTSQQAEQQRFLHRGLRRSAMFLRDAVVLSRRGSRIGANSLVRCSFEAWLVTLWVLAGKDDAVTAVERRQPRNSAWRPSMAIPHERLFVYLNQPRSAICVTV